MAETTTRNAFHVICSLGVRGGFLDGFQVAFDEQLNCIIGGRGTGKTTVLEILRWALDHMPDQKTSAIHWRHIDKLVQANLGNGVVEVDIKTESGLPYKVRRSYGQAPMILNSAGEPMQIEIGRGSIFSADVYSQSQIEDIANDPLFQLNLIDRFIPDVISDIAGKLATCIRELSVNGEEILKMRGDVAALKEKVSLLPEITEKLKTYKVDERDKQGQALKKSGEERVLRDREVRALDRLKGGFADAVSRLNKVSSDLSEAAANSVDKAILDGPNGAIFLRLRDLAVGGAQEVRRGLEEAIRRMNEFDATLTQSAVELSAVHLRQEKAYQDLLALRDQEKDQATERDKLLKRQAELQEEQKRLDKHRQELQEKERARASMLRRLSELRDTRFSNRVAVAKRLTTQLGPAIHIEIEQYGNTEAYREVLLEVMKGAGFKYAQVVDRAVERIPPHELVVTIQAGDAQSLAEDLEIDTDRANRFLLQLKDKPAVFDVEVVDLHDRPTIKLLDGTSYKDTTAISTGQKCTTILPILLLESASPLLIDQPEDNLDNAFIYETVVKSVRGVSDKRQLIFVTHNPNIPVLGDAQRVIVLQSNGRMGSVKAVGTVDEVKDEIETVLEGGREAFRRRKERYGY